MRTDWSINRADIKEAADSIRETWAVNPDDECLVAADGLIDKLVDLLHDASNFCDNNQLNLHIKSKMKEYGV